jgi:transcriptional regulator with XRE-family HTH domain
MVNMPAHDRIPAEGNGADPASLEELGRRLRETRRARDMTQVHVAELLNCDHTAVSRIESGKYPLTPQMLRAVERLLSFASADGYETWFISYLEIEQRATVLHTWEPLAVPGLLQTEGYAREVLRGAHPGRSDADLEQRVAARMARQKIWEREDPPPPMLSAILGEAVVRRRVGVAEVMQDQLRHVLAMTASSPRVTVQVLPFGAPGRCGLLAPFVVASFAPGPDPDAAYLDNALDGHTTERREQVARLSLLYDTLAREALNPSDSAEMIMRAIEGWT